MDVSGRYIVRRRSRQMKLHYQIPSIGYRRIVMRHTLICAPGAVTCRDIAILDSCLERLHKVSDAAFGKGHHAA